MSAIRMTCPACGGQYMAGMVGRRPWPPHECPLQAAFRDLYNAADDVFEERASSASLYHALRIHKPLYDSLVAAAREGQEDD